MKPASCFGDLASFSNRQKRLQQKRRYAVDIHNDDFRTRLLVVLLAKPTNVVLCSRQQIQFRWYLQSLQFFAQLENSSQISSLGYFLMKEGFFWTKLLFQLPYLSSQLITLQRN